MDTSLPYEKTVFPNGTRLILVPMAGVNSVATCVMVEAGSRYETPEINGVSHFLEHMVFKGTVKFPTTEDVNFIERLGGLQNAYTDIDITNYHNKVAAPDWKEALEINKELGLNPRLEEQYVEKERQVILEEMKRYNDELPAMVSEEFQRLMYRGTSLGMRVIGEEQSLLAANAETLRSYHDRMYTPDRIVVILAGSMDAAKRKNIRSQAEEWFGLVTGKTDVQLTPVTDAQTAPALSVITKPDAQQAHLTIGFRTFNRKSEDRFSWNVFNLLFGVSFTSRLFREIREKRGLCYTIRSGSDNWDDAGYWSIYAGVATERVQEAVSAIAHELTNVVSHGVTPEEVTIAKKRLITMISFKSEDPEFMAEYYGQQELRHIPILTLTDYFRMIEEVTADRINALVRKYIVQQTLNMALVWNKPEDPKLMDLLKV